MASSPPAGGEAAGCALDNSLTNIQWLGKMGSDGGGSCRVKQEVEDKENRHLEQGQVKVSCPVLHGGLRTRTHSLWEGTQIRWPGQEDFRVLATAPGFLRLRIMQELPFCPGPASPACRGIASTADPPPFVSILEMRRSLWKEGSVFNGRVFLEDSNQQQVE